MAILVPRSKSISIERLARTGFGSAGQKWFVISHVFSGNHRSRKAELPRLDRRISGETVPVSRPRKRRLRASLLGVLFSMALALSFIGIGEVEAQPITPEYKLKAVFLFNFVQFVDWPESAFTETNSPLVIGVLGNDPFGRALDATVESELVHNRKLEVRRYQKVSEIQKCHVLFISRSETANLKAILAAVKGKTILTVGDSPDFANSGGMIGFFKEQNKIRFRINVQAAKEAHLSISAKLLQLADVVPEKRP